MNTKNKKMEDIRNEKEHFEFRAEIKGILAEMEANGYVLNEKLDRILDQTTKTNGRVTALESDIDFIRVFKKYKWMFGLIILGIYLLVKTVDLQKLVNFVL